MNMIDTLAASPPAGMDATEWHARLELAACYRIFHHFGWTEVIFNHISLRIGEGTAHGDSTYLINPYGLHYSEVNASNLLKIDINGTKLSPSDHPVNQAGFIIHSAIHRARPDAHCVIHTHTDAGMAVACKQGGLRHDNFYSAALYGNVAYHAFEGVTTGMEEQDRIIESLGSCNYLILRNHGLLAVGSHVPGALHAYWKLQRACDIQVMADSMSGPNHPVPEEVLRQIPAQSRPMHVGGGRPGQMFFDAMLRQTGVSADSLCGVLPS